MFLGYAEGLQVYDIEVNKVKSIRFRKLFEREVHNDHLNVKGCQGSRAIET